MNEVWVVGRSCGDLKEIKGEGEEKQGIERREGGVKKMRQLCWCTGAAGCVITL